MAEVIVSVRRLSLHQIAIQEVHKNEHTYKSSNAVSLWNAFTGIDVIWLEYKCLKNNSRGHGECQTIIIASNRYPRIAQG